MDWFYAKNNQQLGPVSFEALAAMLQRGEVQAGDLVWHDGMPSWIPASTAPELAHIFQGTASSIGYYNAVAAARAGLGSQVEYAGFWLRFVAYIIDSILLGILNFILNMIFQVQGSIFMPHSGTQAAFTGFFVVMAEWAIAWLYFAFMESSQMQATLGKLALGLVVTDMSGQRITFGRATGRYFGKIISGLTLLIGYMMAGWTQQKQALHDIMANCLVIRRR
jgi:uncharacterized RDD family membrane protein YckC